MVFTSEPNTNMQLLTTMEKVKCWVSTSVEGWSKETAYFRYVQGLMQPVIVLMSSYRNRKRPSFKSSIILKQSNKERKRSTCTVGYEYKGVCSCHSSSSTWFYTQPGESLDGRKAIWTFSEPFLKYSSGHRWRSCIQDQGCKGPLEGRAPSPDQFRQVEGCVPRRPLRLPLISYLFETHILPVSKLDCGNCQQCHQALSSLWSWEWRGWRIQDSRGDRTHVWYSADAVTAQGRFGPTFH